MNAALAVAALLTLALALGLLRSRGPRRGMRAVLQALCAGALWLLLFPPSLPQAVPAGELVVLTPGVTAAQFDALPALARTVALPGVDAPRTIERAPDLASALRRHADATRIRVVGGGLPLRDHDAAAGRVAHFDAAPLPRGIVELAAPAWLAAGHSARIEGRVEGADGGRIELRDAASRVVAEAPLDAQGRYALPVQAKAAGTATFRLRALDRDGARIDELALPLAVRAGGALRLRFMAGAPDAELKYLRRWASDAGLAPELHVTLSDGVVLASAAPERDAAALAGLDLVVLDERAWAALDAPQRDALLAAVEAGLGLLLRANALPDAATLADWQRLGFTLRAAEATATVTLARSLDRGTRPLSFSAAPIEVEASDPHVIALRADGGEPLLWWLTHGRGRIGLLRLTDSFRLSLAGQPQRHAQFWSETVARLARARGSAAPQLPADARVDQRAVLCGLQPEARIEIADGSTIDLAVGGADDARPGCAAYWPSTPGWQVLLDGDERWPLHVRAADEGAALLRGEIARATRALVGSRGGTMLRHERAPRPRWPFLLALLAAAAPLWWLERRGRRAVASS